MRRRWVAAAALAVGGTAVFTSCSSPVDEFCDQLEATYDLHDLRAALDRDDQRAIEAAMRELQLLVDLSPADIRADVEAVTGAVVDAVRAVVPVEAPDGGDMPVDLARLNAALDAVAPSSARVQEFGRRHCQYPTTTLESR